MNISIKVYKVKYTNQTIWALIHKKNTWICAFIVWFVYSFHKKISHDHLNKLIFEICGLKDSFLLILLWRGIFWFLVGKAMKGKWIISSASGAQNAGRGDRIAEARRHRERGTAMVLRGLDVVLKIRRLRRSFRGAYGGTAPPSSHCIFRNSIL